MVPETILQLRRIPYAGTGLHGKVGNLIPLMMSLLLLFSCQKDPSKEKEGIETNQPPSQVIYGADVIQKDSGRIRARFKAPLVEKYELVVDSPYTEVKRGIYLEFYGEKASDTTAKFWANHAKIAEKSNLYEAKGDVKAVDSEGKEIETQSVYWDKKSKKIHTKDSVFVTEADGSKFVSSEGMEAKDDFSEYIFFNNSGRKTIPEDKSIKK